MNLKSVVKKDVVGPSGPRIHRNAFSEEKCSKAASVLSN
jgi:hypothetical protein